ncbi:MAG: hypothetical protein LBN29_06255 [Mediterranea sp.]|nr:hypothetical protein [Mediterranea sp.]
MTDKSVTFASMKQADQKKKITQRDQVAEAMRSNGGYATFGQLNQLVDFSDWKTGTPQASIRRIVQDDDRFFRIQPGLWALKESEDDVLRKFQLKEPNAEREEVFTHSYYQGLVVEIGNLKGLRTYVPPQDKNRKFLEKPLCEMATVEPIYEFTYREILERARTVDVIWFNERRLPSSFFEIEHTTDIQNSLGKFFDLQDFFASFRIVADKSRKNQFESIISRAIYKDIRKRVGFVSYDEIIRQHENLYRLSRIENLI